MVTYDGSSYVALTDSVGQAPTDNEYWQLVAEGSKIYQSVAEMKADTNLKEGMAVSTLGYYEPNDGGAAKYNIVNDETLIDDGGTVHVLANNMRAKLIINNYVTPEMFGCYGDNSHDDTEKFQNALNKCLYLKLNPEKNYKISETLVIRNGTQIEGAGISSKITSYIDDGSSLFYNEDSVLHFLFKDFYINGNNKNCYGFIFTNPYDSCVFKNLYFDNFTKSCLKLGNSEKISQTLLIDNCVVYMSSSVELNTPIFHLIKCYETNLLNSKLLNRVGNYNSSPCLLLENVYDNNIQGNSFTCSHDCAIKIEGSDCKHNRIISNTYELIDGDYSIKLIGSSASSILHTLIIEPFTYYSAPKKMYCENEANAFIVGMDVVGGRRNMCFNVNSDNVQTATGNCTLTTDGGKFTSTGGFGITGYDGIKKYDIFSNESATSDYGLEIKNTTLNKKFSIDFSRNYFGMDNNGGRIRLKSPNGTQKYLGLNDNGEIQLYTYPS